MLLAWKMTGISLTENDLVLLSKSTDKFSNLITSLLGEEIGAEFHLLLKFVLSRLTSNKYVLWMSLQQNHQHSLEENVVRNFMCALVQLAEF